VFQTLFFGKAGQSVPGKTGPEGATGGEVVAVVGEVEVVVEDRVCVEVVVAGTDDVVDAAVVDLVVATPGRWFFPAADVEEAACMPGTFEVEVVVCL
jgi:hypothetical protein